MKPKKKILPALESTRANFYIVILVLTLDKTRMEVEI